MSYFGVECSLILKPMKRWKYGTKKTVSELNSTDLNKYGEKGWELVSVVYCELVGYTYYFKQEVL